MVACARVSLRAFPTIDYVLAQLDFFLSFERSEREMSKLSKLPGDARLSLHIMHFSMMSPGKQREAMR